MKKFDPTGKFLTFFLLSPSLLSSPSLPPSFFLFLFYSFLVTDKRGAWYLYLSLHVTTSEKTLPTTKWGGEEWAVLSFLERGRSIKGQAEGRLSASHTPPNTHPIHYLIKGSCFWNRKPPQEYWGHRETCLCGVLNGVWPLEAQRPLYTVCKVWLREHL